MQPTERFNAISHLVGATLALAGGGVLITVAKKTGDARAILSSST